MTGCYPLRVGMDENSMGYWVLFPGDSKGLNPDEVTIAEILKEQDYVTACIGKWHLGDQPGFLPNNQGFDYYFGIPYSNDMGNKGNSGNPPLPLLRNMQVIEAPVNQSTITRRYTEEAISFIEQNRKKPFFLYLPHTMPHYPLNSSVEFSGKSKNGKYGDAIEEIDWSTGQILKTLRDLGLDQHTMVVFTSDNGATRSGSNAPFSGGKCGIMEGSMREPCVMWWPGHIPSGKTCSELVTVMDMLPTMAHLSGGELPGDRVIDGKDITSLVLGEPGAKSPHEVFYYYFMSQLQAVRSGKWKLFLPMEERQYGWKRERQVAEAELFNLETDPAELVNLIDLYPGVTQRLMEYAEEARADIGDYLIKGENARPAGIVEDPVFLIN
jgi:arylsulfatase A-like enzyme